jgi:glycosyltransferase involved in cell wall biosynthesis
LRIAVWHNLPSGGGKRALYNHVKALKERGHYLEAWTTDMSSDDYLPLTDFIIEHRLPVKANIYKAYNYANPIKRIQKQISFMEAHCKSCIQEIESQGFDLIFANSCSFSYMSYISNFSNIPTVIYLGEPFRPFFEALPENVWQAPSYEFKIKNIRLIINDFKQNYANRIQLREEIKAAKKYNAILVNSLFSRENIIRAYGIDAKVCYLGIDKIVFKPYEYNKEPYVVGLGKISLLKSLNKSIRVISKIPLEFRPVLKWISNGIDEQYFKEIISLAKELSVQFEPLINISEDEVKKVLSCAAVMIYTPYLEPFGLAPLEANACGTYVVATPEGGVRESIVDGKNGYLINGFEEILMSKAIIKFVTDLNYAKRKGEEAFTYVHEKWNWQMMADNIERILTEIINLPSNHHVMKKIKLNICSLGDPTSPETWSGTPFNLYSELLKINCLGTAFSSSASTNKYERKLIKLINRFYYKNSVHEELGFLPRYLNARKVKRETALSNSNYTLHTGGLDLPFKKSPKNQRHYLFCDSNFILWSSHSTRMNGDSKKLIIDADKLEKKGYHQMEHIFTTSEYVKNNFIEHYEIDPEKITVVGTGLGIIKPFYGKKNYTNGKILFAAKGSFEEKGGHLALEAFKIALKINPKLELTIVGHNEYTEKINLPNVKTCGFIAIGELQDIFNDSSLFLMPAINEIWGLVYLEALACKIPIIGLNRNSFPEISDYGNYGFGLDNADPAKLAKIIVNAFENPEQLSEMGQKAQEYCLNKFTWNNTVSKIIKTIENKE